MSNEEHLASIDAALNALGIFAKRIADRLDELPTGRELLMGLVLAAHVKHDGLVFDDVSLEQLDDLATRISNVARRQVMDPNDY